MNAANLTTTYQFSSTPFEYITEKKSGSFHPQGNIYCETITHPREDRFIENTTESDPLRTSMNWRTQIRRDATKQVLLEHITDPGQPDFIQTVLSGTDKRALQMIQKKDAKKKTMKLRPDTKMTLKEIKKRPVTSFVQPYNSLRNLVDKRVQILTKNLGLTSYSQLAKPLTYLLFYF